MIPIIVEVAISLMVVYYLMSTLVSFINEIIALAISSRGKTLKNSLHELLEEGKKETDGMVDRLYRSPHIHKLRIFSFLKSKNYLPATIQAGGFSNALIEIIHKGANYDLTAVSESIDALSNPFLKNHLKKLIAELDVHQQNIQGFKQKIEQWFNAYMETVTRVYKLRIRVIVALISLVVCVMLQIDTIGLMKYFWENKEKREMMVRFADRAEATDTIHKLVVAPADSNSQTRSDTLISKTKGVVNTLYSFDLPIAYQTDPLRWGTKGDGSRLFMLILGILISACCLTLGAPFWFDLMKRMVSVRKKIGEM